MAWLGLPLALAGCGASASAPPAPPALAGLWSVGEAACAAGRGVRFEEGAVRVHLSDGPQTLLQGAHYRLRRSGGAWHVRIRYRLPDAPTARGEIDLVQGADGWLRPTARRVGDGVSGSMRLALRDQALGGALTVRPCAGRWGERDLARVLPAAPVVARQPAGLRGRG